MHHVAEAAGVSRAHLYNLVSNRAALIELALIARVEEYSGELEASARTVKQDIVEAIVEQMLLGVTLALTDPEFGRLADALPRHRLAHLLNAADSPIHSIFVRSIEPLIAQAVAAGRLRTDVPLQRIYTWLQSLHAQLASRDDLDDMERRQILTDFVLPSILDR
jgi:AcrR family transcriptional regulator